MPGIFRHGSKNGKATPHSRSVVAYRWLRPQRLLVRVACAVQVEQNARTVRSALGKGVLVSERLELFRVCFPDQSTG